MLTEKQTQELREQLLKLSKDELLKIVKAKVWKENIVDLILKWSDSPFEGG